MVTVFVQLHPQNSAAALARSPRAWRRPSRPCLAERWSSPSRCTLASCFSTGEPTWSHALGLAASLASIGLDAPGRAAGVLFAAPSTSAASMPCASASARRSPACAGVEKLYQLRVATRGNPHEQNEVLRKMVLGMVEDVRVS